MIMASSKTILKAYLHRSNTFFLGGTALALILFCPLPERIFPAKVQDILREQKRLSDSQYGESWHKERRRPDPLNSQKDNITSTSNRGHALDDSTTQKGAMFIPMTWLRKREPEPYSASDPEWQGFVTLSKDAKQMTAVKTRLCEVVCEHLRQVLTRVIGKQLTVHKSWLDFQFPSAPPAVYERSGILWTDDQISWTTRRVDERQVVRVYRVLLPTALVSSLQALSTTLLKSHYASLKSLWLSSDISERQRPAGQPIAKPLSSATVEGERRGISSANTPNGSSTSPQNLTSATTPDSQATLIHSMLPKPEPDSAISAATKAFKLNFLKKWLTPPVLLPRGVCLLKGEIGIHGSNGRVKISVTAVYLPKEDRFVSLKLTHAEIFPHRQAPIGKKKAENVSKSDNDSKS